MEAKWYVVRTFSGHENKVKQLLEAELQENEQVKSKIREILVPTEKVFELVNTYMPSPLSFMVPLAECFHSKDTIPLVCPIT